MDRMENILECSYILENSFWERGDKKNISMLVFQIGEVANYTYLYFTSRQLLKTHILLVDSQNVYKNLSNTEKHNAFFQSKIILEMWIWNNGSY